MILLIILKIYAGYADCESGFFGTKNDSILPHSSGYEAMA